MINQKNFQEWLSYITPLVIIFIIFLTIICVEEQILRQNANDPQIQMAEDGARQIEAGIPALNIIPQDTVDLEKSLAPFVIVFDDQGKPIASSASLEGAVPVPPQGVFDNTRKLGEERLTWEPKKSVREAAVIKHFDGQNPGFILVARSLEEVEARKFYLSLIILVGFTFSVVIAIFGMFLHYKFKKG